MSNSFIANGVDEGIGFLKKVLTEMQNRVCSPETQGPVINNPSFLSGQFDDVVEKNPAGSSPFSILFGRGPTLPRHQSRQSPNALEELAKAFCSAFTTMDSGLITQTKEFTQLQELDQTEAEIVLRSTTLATNKMAKEAHIEENLEEYQKKVMDEANDLMTWSFWLGIAAVFVSLGTSLVSILPDSFPVLAAGWTEMTGQGIGDGLIELSDFSQEEMENEIGDEATAQKDDLDDLNEEQVVDKSLTDTDTGNVQQEQQEKSLAKTENGSENTLKGDIGRYLLKMGIASTFASPMLLQGMAKMGLANRQAELSQIQKELGGAISVMQRNTGNFQFMQSLLQRQSSTVVNEIQEAGDIVQTYGQIVGSYNSISSQFASRV